VRQLVLTPPVSDLTARTDTEKAAVRDQLDLLEAGDRSAGAELSGRLARDTIAAADDPGDARRRVERMLAGVDPDGRCPDLLHQISVELAKESVLQVVKHAAGQTAVEPALDALAILLSVVFAVPTGPVGMLLLAAKLLEIAEH
jgi:hypothetical protein